MQETDSPQLQEMVMHRVSAIVHCTAVIPYNHNRNHDSLYYLFQENKAFGTHYHLHSSSDVWEVVLRTVALATFSAYKGIISSITLERMSSKIFRYKHCMHGPRSLPIVQSFVCVHLTLIGGRLTS
jgi:hypothetical protein